MQTICIALIVVHDLHTDVRYCFIVFIYYTHLYGSERKCQVTFLLSSWSRVFFERLTVT
jgi:uncharacterized protein (DUF486 family)